MIELKNICKTFKVAKRNAGISEAVKALFQKEYTYINALQDISFTIGRLQRQHFKNLYIYHPHCPVPVLSTPQPNRKIGSCRFIFFTTAWIVSPVRCYFVYRFGLLKYKSTGS